MKIYDINLKNFIEPPKNVINFLSDLEMLYKKYNISISHEDEQGSFILTNYNDKNLAWIKNSSLDIK